MADQNKALEVRKQKFVTVQNFFDSKKGQIQAVLPKHMTPERMMRIALTSIARNPILLECTPQSLFSAVLQSSVLGLEPDGVLGRAHLIPFKNKGVYEAQFQVGYKGLVELAYRSDRIESFQAQIVHENDLLEYEEGLDAKLRHVPSRKNRGEKIAAYTIVRFKGGGYSTCFMWREDIEEIRDRFSQSWKFQGERSVWGTNPDAMWLKTVAKRHTKWLPLSPEMAKAIAMDDQSEAGTSQEYDIDVTGDNPEDVIDVSPSHTEEKTTEKRDELKERLRGGKQQAETALTDRPTIHCPKHNAQRSPSECEDVCRESKECKALAEYNEASKE